jgi:hypothetical protein
MSVTTLTKRAAADEEAVLGDELFQKARPLVVEHVRRMRTVSDVDGYNDAHRKLLVEYAARQIAAAETDPRHRAHAHREIERLRAIMPRPVQELRVMQDRLGLVRRQEMVSRALQQTLRVVADGLVWRAMDFERTAFAVLGHGVRVGKLASGTGWDAEIRTEGYLLNAQRGLVVHNDLPTCLRHGDVTVIELGSSPRRVSVAEVKAKDGRVNWSQADRLDDALDLLRTGYHPTANAGGPIRIHQIASEYASHIGELGPLVARAHDDIVAWNWIRPWLAVAVCDLRAAAADHARLERGLADYWNAVRRGPGISYAFLDRRIAGRHDSNSWFVPTSLLPLAAEDVADVLMGYIEILSFLDLGALSAHLRESGLTAAFARDQNGPVFFAVQVGDRTVVVPGTLREQMLTEFMDPSALVAAVEHVASVREEDLGVGEAVMLAFRDEGRAWRTSPAVSARA